MCTYQLEVCPEQKMITSYKCDYCDPCLANIAYFRAPEWTQLMYGSSGLSCSKPMECCEGVSINVTVKVRTPTDELQTRFNLFSRLAAKDDGTSAANGTGALTSGHFHTGIGGHRRITSHPHPYPNPTRYKLLTPNSNESYAKWYTRGLLALTSTDVASRYMK
ncbi:hypothetical protein X797_009907 [Metarhizium robertsii]|uniref:Uncharacterized protein n=1 Tax=Metarhizium robertsii TaxID=568076 RepID=A0A0A1UQ31_9HYPO|nr:hypothetical protein X797_009907 [Metarhizium robertsii]